MIPYSIKTNNEIHSSAYLSGIMTHPDYRGRGYMTKLLNASFDAMKKKKYDYTFLIPQEEKFIPVYEKFGFQWDVEQRQAASGKQEAVLERSGNRRKQGYFVRHYHELQRKVEETLCKLSPAEMYPDYCRLLTAKENVVLKTGQQFANLLLEFYLSGGVLFFGEDRIAFTVREKRKIILKELLYSTDADKDKLLETISLHYRLDEFVFPDENKGMIKKLNPDVKDITNLYMGMVLD
jgi:hypothetical protein